MCAVLDRDGAMHWEAAQGRRHVRIQGGRLSRFDLLNCRLGKTSRYYCLRSEVRVLYAYNGQTKKPRTKIAQTYENESWFGVCPLRPRRSSTLTVKPRFLTRAVRNLGSWFLGLTIVLWGVSFETQVIQLV